MRPAIRACSVVLAALCVVSPVVHAAPQYAAGTQTGTAAFYSHVFDGRKTSDHGTFHSNKMTAASATFDLGTRVRVTNLKNNRSVVVRITDRYADKNRLLDVSKAAAEKLGFVRAGTAQVRAEPLGK